MNARESEIRRKLGVSDAAKKVFVLEQSAHLDWDWQTTFEGYYAEGYTAAGHQPVRKTFHEAIHHLQEKQSASTPYRYTICEMSYLRRFLQEYPDQASVLRGFGDLRSRSPAEASPRPTTS